MLSDTDLNLCVGPMLQSVHLVQKYFFKTDKRLPTAGGENDLIVACSTQDISGNER